MTFGEWLEQELRSRHLSQREFARLAGVSQGHISGVIAGGRNVGADFVIQAARALDVSPVLALQIAGLLTADDIPTTDDPQAARALDYFAQISPEQRVFILDFLQFLASVK